MHRDSLKLLDDAMNFRPVSPMHPPHPKTILRSEALARRRARRTSMRPPSPPISRSPARPCRRMRPGIVSAYFALRDEASTMPLLEALGRGRRADRPADHRRAGNAARVSAMAPRRCRWSKAKWAFRSRPPRRPKSRPICCFVPLAAFDRTGHRIGYGAGFYDRTLAGLRARKKICAVGSPTPARKRRKSRMKVMTSVSTSC